MALDNLPLWRDRLYARTQRGAECWEWTGTKDRDGYGTLSHYEGGGRRNTKRRIHKAHRVAWEVHKGPIPAGAWVLHRCDNRGCVNPDHLFLGDAIANNADKMAKGRHRGAPMARANGNGKLSEADTADIRQRMTAGERIKDIAAIYGISPSYLRMIREGKRRCRS